MLRDTLNRFQPEIDRLFKIGREMQIKNPAYFDGFGDALIYMEDFVDKLKKEIFDGNN